MEQVWNRAGATAGKRSRRPEAQKRLKREGFIATSVDAFRADICGCTVRAKAAVFGLLGWNSYGTEGAQRVAKVRLAERHGKEGVDGSSPSEGFAKFLQFSSFC